MKITTTDKKVTIEVGGKIYTVQLGSILCEKTDNGITLLIDRVTLPSNFSQITVNGTQITEDNADELLDALFKLGNGGGVSLPIEIADVNNLQAGLDKKADLGDDGLVVAWQIPSTLDQIIEGELINDTDFDVDGFIIEPENSKIYVDTITNKTYRWSGSQYSEISPSIGLGETINTAYRGDRGKTAYDHSQLTSGNPHKVTKSDVGLSNVDNTSDINKPVSTAQQNAINSAVNNIKLGCANLLYGSDYTTNRQAWTHVPSAVIEDGISYVKYSYAWSFVQNMSDRLEVGKTYTLTGLFRAKVSGSSVRLSMGGTNGQNEYIANITTSWQRKSITFTVNESANTSSVYFLANTDVQVIDFARMSIVEGNKGLANWERSQEDLIVKLKELEDRITALEG